MLAKYACVDDWQVDNAIRREQGNQRWQRERHSNEPTPFPVIK